MSKKLTRKMSDKMVAGVAAGLADYFQLDVTWLRIAFAFAALVGGSGIWIYLILWIVVPEHNVFADYDKNQDPNFQWVKDKSANASTAKLIAGLALVVFGFYFLLDEFGIIPYWFDLGKLWPLIFVGFGVAILMKATRQETPDIKEEKKETEEAEIIIEDDTEEKNNSNL